MTIEFTLLNIMFCDMQNMCVRGLIIDYQFFDIWKSDKNKYITRSLIAAKANAWITEFAGDRTDIWDNAEYLWCCSFPFVALPSRFQTPNLFFWLLINTWVDQGHQIAKNCVRFFCHNSCFYSCLLEALHLSF